MTLIPVLDSQQIDTLFQLCIGTLGVYGSLALRALLAQWYHARRLAQAERRWMQALQAFASERGGILTQEGNSAEPDHSAG